MLLEKEIKEKEPLYLNHEALAEANRCLNCFDAPCTKACPSDIDVAKFIRRIAGADEEGAAKAILSQNILGYSCSRVCPVDVLCVGACVHNQNKIAPIQIGRLQRYATKKAIDDFGFAHLAGKKKPATGKKVALVGAGPASLSAAALLTLQGHQAIVFEKESLAGGLNSLGIAPYKLKHEDAQQEIEWIESLGVEIRTGVSVGNTDFESQVSTATLLKDFDAVFLGIGIGEDSQMNIEGSLCQGVVGALSLIKEIKTNPDFGLKNVKTAHIIGGGNTAIDIAHELKLLGIQNVVMIYRRDEKDMPGYAFELTNARASGVHFVPHTEVTKVFSQNGNIVGIEVNNKKENLVGNFASDLLVVAIGQNKSTKLALSFDGVSTDQNGRVIVDPNTGRTGNKGVWSAGDCVNGGKEVVNAISGAKIAVKDMLRYLNVELKEPNVSEESLHA